MKKKVLIIHPGILGGIRREIEYLIQAWDDLGEAPPYKRIDARGVESVLWSPFFLAFGLLVALKEILLGRVCLMYVNMSIGASTVRKGSFIALAALTRTPVILHLHSGRYGYYYEELSPWKKRIVRWLFHYPVKVIVLGEIWRDFVIEQIGVDPERIVIMPNAVPAPKVPVEGAANGVCRLLFLGWIGPDKGIPELLNALADERVKALNWSCVLAGRDPRVADGRVGEYRRRAEELGLQDRIEVPGWLGKDKVEQLLRDSDITLLPSHYEGLPMTVVEGMAYGHAVIATPVGALPEIIEHDKSGILIPVGDEKQLADALYATIGDPALRARLGQAAFETFREKLDILPYARRLKELFHENGLPRE